MYHFLKLTLHATALLPWSVLYVLSDGLFFLIYHVLRYRRKMVKRNLAAAFPDHTAAARNLIAQRFYRNFCDQIVETIKLLHASPEEIVERFRVDTLVYDKLHAEGRHVLQATMHQFNWEWGNWVLNHRTSFAIRIIYMMVGSRTMQRIVNDFRLRHGALLIPANDLKALMNEGDKPSLTVFLADQNPSDRKRALWVPFFGREIPFHRGLEILARKKGHAVVFDEIIRVARGHYSSKSYLICVDGTTTTEGQITRMYVQFLQESISRQPHNWLWTHNRWKHARTSTTL